MRTNLINFVRIIGWRKWSKYDTLFFIVFAFYNGLMAQTVSVSQQATSIYYRTPIIDIDLSIYQFWETTTPTILFLSLLHSALSRRPFPPNSLIAWKLRSSMPVLHNNSYSYQLFDFWQEYSITTPARPSHISNSCLTSFDYPVGENCN